VRHARRFFLTAERFSAAERFGSVSCTTLPRRRSSTQRSTRSWDRCCRPGRRRKPRRKDLIRAVAHQPIDEHMIGDTAERIAWIRGSPEGREGVASFLDKRYAAWVPAALKAD
jgi:methylglutaconyl-CoA hydratase